MKTHLAFLAFLLFPVIALSQEAGKGEEPSDTKSKSEPGGKSKPAYPDPATVEAAMKKAAMFCRRELSFAGGYAWRWPKDGSTAETEGRVSPSVIGMQPPGTPSVGLVMIAAYQATRDPLYLQAAREAAQALVWCQLASGGWDSDFDFQPRLARKYHFRRDLEAGDTERGTRHGDSTLDDQKTQSALLFLLELAHLPESKDDAPLHRALKFGLDGLLAAQAPNGGWGQHYDGPADKSATVTKAKIPAEWSRVWPGVDYTRHYTLNDGNIYWVTRLLLRAHQLTGDARYLETARRAGDFLLLAQLPEPQPAWAQQYNRDMEPAWARKFEPPALSTGESFGALRTLHELWIATGEEKYLAPHKATLAWLERCRLPDGKWSRFHELGSNKPLYCVAETYELTYDDSKLPTHYGFKLDELGEDIEDFKKELAMSREDLQAKRADPADEKKWTSKAKGAAAKVAKALSTQEKRGCWMKGEMIDSGEFVKHMQAMATYVRSAKNGGVAFQKLREQSAAAGK